MGTDRTDTIAAGTSRSFSLKQYKTEASVLFSLEQCKTETYPKITHL